jgi:hypothetical protein
MMSKLGAMSVPTHRPARRRRVRQPTPESRKPTTTELPASPSPSAPKPTHPRRRSNIRWTAGVLLLVLLSAALVDLVAAIGTIATDQVNQPRLGPAKKPSRWQTAVGDAAPAPNASRRLNLHLHARTLDVSYELTLPAGHSLVHAVERGDAEADPAAFVDDVLGQVQIGELPWWPRSSTRSLVFDTLPFDRPTVEIRGKDNQAVIRLNSETWNVDLQRVRITVAAPTGPRYRRHHRAARSLHRGTSTRRPEKCFRQAGRQPYRA